MTKNEEVHFLKLIGKCGNEGVAGNVLKPIILLKEDENLKNDIMIADY